MLSDQNEDIGAEIDLDSSDIVPLLSPHIRNEKLKGAYDHINKKVLDALMKHTLGEDDKGSNTIAEKMKILVEGEYLERSGADVTVKLIDKF